MEIKILVELSSEVTSRNFTNSFPIFALNVATVLPADYSKEI